MRERTESGVYFASLMVGIVVAIVAFLFFLFGGFRTIDAEEVGIKVTFGKVSEKPYYGFNFKWPLVSKFIRFEKTTQRYEGTDATYTKDIQSANIDYVFTYKIVDANAPQLYLSAGTEFEAKLITPVLRSVIKNVVGKWGAQELVANRDKASAEIHQKLQEELSAEFFAEISFQMSNVDYSDAFEKGIESKFWLSKKLRRRKIKPSK
jgi:regulator of protease activity HflC (stomatin/prohibitin superfamily)